MRNVQVRPVRDLRNNYAELETLIEAHDLVIITKNGRGAAVLLNINDFAEVEEYLHYKYVAEKLDEAEVEAAKPGAQWMDYKTVMSRLKEKYAGV
ncbi:MAG: type II toxin-antitoxin system Phd/YefM family antitoxin [Treponema sp.]|jgi:prevent-host-death family protein|nr:type II toxin-antitoxin system Phd/YefM family antitoxin [Treponema sp.]